MIAMRQTKGKLVGMGIKRACPFSSPPAKRARMFRTVRRWFGYKPRKSYRRTSSRRLYRRRYKRTRNIKRLRARQRQRANKKSLVTVFRDKYTLKPTDGIINWITYASLDNFDKIPEYARLFDEFKILRIYQKFRLERSANVENNEDDIDIVHWSAYDPDARARKFKDLDQFRKCPNAKWHIFKPYQVRTSSMTPTFMRVPQVDTGIKSVNNPWFDCGTQQANFSTNAIQHIFVGPSEGTPGKDPKYKIIIEETIKVAYRGLRQGQAYK